MRGDHLVVDRGLYRHHAIDRGDGTVVHFAAPLGDKIAASVRVDSFEDFASGGIVWVRFYGQRLDREEAACRAESMIGTTGYHLVSNNCEHLASWCATGSAESRQVERVTAGGAMTAAAIVTSIGCAEVLAALGSVSGLSGPGVMSALATVGGLAGGGAVQGLYLLGLVPGLLGATAVVYAARDKPHLTNEERCARTAARYAAAVGGIATGIAGLHIVSAAGVVVGLSGPGIASGLASIGGLAGGGMVVGASLLAAAPALAAGLLGWLAYRAAIWWMTGPGQPGPITPTAL